MQLDLDGIAHEDATCLKCHIPVEAEVLAVDLGLGGEASALLALVILYHTIEGGVEHHLLGDAADCQVAVDTIFVVAYALYALAREGDGGEMLHVEEVGGAQVVVAELDAGAERGYVNASGDGRADDVVHVEIKGRVELAEVTLYC